MNVKRRFAFTLAEVLIALGVVGVVSAITMPVLIKNYQKHVTVTRLKKAYSELYQAVNMSIKDNDAIENWDFTLSINNVNDFFDKYINPYIKYKKSGSYYYFNNGVKISYGRYYKNSSNNFVKIILDINGNQKPNKYGKDIFLFYIFPFERNLYNGGNGDLAKNVKHGGLYPDGYGYDRNTLKTDKWRGCNSKGEPNSNGAFCTYLIMYDGWKISDDYNW